VCERIGIRVIVVSAVLLLCTAAAAADLVARAPSSARSPATSQVFRVQGRVAGLYPGAMKQMRVRIRNPHPFPIRVRTLKVRALDASVGCRASTLRIARAKVKEPVPAGRTLKVRVPVRMRRAAPSACMGARYPIRFSATAVRP
jgi:hypothetical protein